MIITTKMLEKSSRRSWSDNQYRWHQLNVQMFAKKKLFFFKLGVSVVNYNDNIAEFQIRWIKDRIKQFEGKNISKTQSLKRIWRTTCYKRKFTGKVPNSYYIVINITLTSVTLGQNVCDQLGHVLLKRPLWSKAWCWSEKNVLKILRFR